MAFDIEFAESVAEHLRALTRSERVRVLDTVASPPESARPLGVAHRAAAGVL